MGDMLGFPKSLIVNYVVRKVKKMVPAFELPRRGALQRCDLAGARQAVRAPQVGPRRHRRAAVHRRHHRREQGRSAAARNLVANLLQAEAWYQPALKKIPAGEQIVTVCALPLYHIFGFNTNMMLAMRMGGCNILIPNPRDIPAMLKELSQHKFHSFPAVNTLFNAIAHHPDFGKVDWSHLKISVGGGMAVQQATAKLWLEKTGCPIVEGYGLSETSPSATCNPVDSTAYSGNIGMPMPNTEIKLLDDDGNEVPIGTPGEIAIRGPQVMAGYWQRPDETAKVMTADGFFRTGDIGTVDERGYFKIVDRKKDMILVSGFNVYPNEVEDVVTQMDGVLECAAVGVPDAKAGEAVKLVIVKCEAVRSPKPTCAPIAKPTSPATSGPRSSSSAPSCRRRRSARSCGASCATRPERAAPRSSTARPPSSSRLADICVRIPSVAGSVVGGITVLASRRAFFTPRAQVLMKQSAPHEEAVPCTDVSSRGHCHEPLVCPVDRARTDERCPSFTESHPWITLPLRTPAPESYFSNLKDGATIETPFLLKFGVSRYGIASIDKPVPKTGHHHLLVNRELPLDFRQPLPFNDQYVHFGRGQMETVLTFKPGAYTLRLLLADDKHIPLFVYSKPLRITVTKNKR